MSSLDLNRIVKVEFPSSQYYDESFNKKQIVLHHTVSGKGVNGDINWWKQTPERVATCVVIDRSGTINQCFSSKSWAHHLGIKSSDLKSMGFIDYLNRNNVLNKESIGIEIDSWGGLVKHTDGFYYPAIWDVKQIKNVPNISAGKVLNVVEYDKPFRGFNAFEAYSTEQIESIRQLILYWSETYNISIKYNKSMWDVSHDAISGQNGIWTHVSYRKDKSDCHPDPNLIGMLSTLSR